MIQEFKKAFRQSVPVLFGYLPLGAAFGILWSTLNLPWYFATLSGLIVYAGAAQFLSVSLISAHMPPLQIFFAIFILNFRHIFYGFSLLKRFRSIPLKPYLIFGLTDETYSLLTANHQKDSQQDKNFCLIVTFLNHFYWIVGCTIGAIFGAVIRIDTQGFEFILTALFVVLTVEQWLSVNRIQPFVVGILASVVGMLFFKPQFLLVATGLATVTFLAVSMKGERNAK